MANNKSSDEASTAFNLVKAVFGIPWDVAEQLTGAKDSKDLAEKGWKAFLNMKSQEEEETKKTAKRIDSSEDLIKGVNKSQYKGTIGELQNYPFLNLDKLNTEIRNLFTSTQNRDILEIANRYNQKIQMNKSRVNPTLRIQDSRIKTKSRGFLE